jgi:hypothetical protein
MSSLQLHSYQIKGALAATGKDVVVTVMARTEEDACRKANQQGVYVSGSCPSPVDSIPPATSRTPTLREVVDGDTVVRGVLKRLPQLDVRFVRLNDEDVTYLSHLAAHERVGHREAAHITRLLSENQQLERT